MSGLRLLLLLAPSYGQELTVKDLTFAKHLRNLGHDVTVLASFLGCRGGQLRDCYRGLPWREEFIDGVRVLRVLLYPGSDGSAVNRIADHVASAMSASIAAMVVPKTDVAYVSHPSATAALPATMLKWLRNVPFVYGMQDVWPNGLAAPYRRTQQRRGRFAMGVIRRHAARVIVPSEGLRHRLVEAGHGEEHVVVIPSAAHEELTPITPDAARVLREAAVQRPWTLATKRAADITVASALLAVAAVPMLGLAAIVRARLGSPVLFRQQRPGRFGRPFTMLKFRTMTDARDSHGDLLPDADRLTPLGTFLRRSSLDELPSLINVVKGDMSLVGPRPLLTRYTDWFTSEERLRLHVRPGITGLAQVHGRNLARWEDRLAHDVTYVQALAITRDISVLLATVRHVLRRTGAVADPESIMRNLDDERRGQRARS